ncbi:MAG: superoxide dismutase [Saprospiraceae bacterium]|nr:superoxide dismutase [Saprospiraceae bacterium]MBK9631078.1 superoxide dismutase [Saprospiraceae bacterium]
MSFTLPALPYPVQSLEPYIDQRTMEIHHGKHHAAYTNNLNAAIQGTDLDQMTIEELLKSMDMNNMVVRNNGGGYYNHCLFWEIMSPASGNKPSAELSTAIDSHFGSFDSFKEKFSQAAMTRFGSGWAWLCVHPGGALEICSTPNQDNPLMPGTGCGGTPILAVDVWEHAYYLMYQNRRADYLNGFFEVVNWEEVSKRYEQGK